MVSARPGNGWLVRALLLAFLTIMPVQAIRPMVSYRALELGAGAVDLGIIAGAYALLSFIMAVPLGRWMDRFGQPRFLVAGTALVTLTALGLAVAGSLVALIAAQAILGLGQVTALIGMQTLLSNHGDPAKRDGRIGGFTVSVAIAQIIGPAAAGTLYAQLDGSLGGVFLLSAGVSFLAVTLAASLWSWPAPSSSAGGPRPRQRSMRREVGTVLRTPSVPHAMVASMTVLTSIDLLIAYLPAYGETVGIPVETVGVLLGAQAGGTLLSRLIMVWLINRLGRQRLLVSSMALSALGLATLPLFTEALALFALISIAGFGLGLGQPLSLAWIVSQVPERTRGTAIGVRLTANRFAQLAIPLAVGAVGGVAGVAAIFVTTGGMLATGAATCASAPMQGPRSGVE